MSDIIITFVENKNKANMPDQKPAFSSTIEKQESFYSELKELLRKYNAEISIENFGRSWADEYKIVIDFDYDESFYPKEGTGCIPQLVLRNYENGR